MKNRDTFSSYHPTVNFLCFALVLLFSMCLMHPVYLAISLTGALAYDINLKGRKAVRFAVMGLLPMAVLAALVTFICDMPLKRKITSHPVPLLLSLLDLLTYRNRHMLYHRLRVSPQAYQPLHMPFRRLRAFLRAYPLLHMPFRRLLAFLWAYQLPHMPFRRLHLSVPCPVCSIQKCLLMPFYLPPVICVFSGFRPVAFTE